MVNYKLGIINNGIRVIDLNTIVNLETLKYLDKFTSGFKSEGEFKAFLLRKGLITIKDLKENIRVIYSYKNAVKKLDVIYDYSKNYLDTVYLYNRLNSLSNDIRFLEKLVEHYSKGSERYNQSFNISDIRLYINDARRTGGYLFYSKILDNAIESLFKKATLRYDKNTRELKQDYRGLRDLALFIYDYDSKFVNFKKINNQGKNEQTFEQMTFTDIIEGPNKTKKLNNL